MGRPATQPSEEATMTRLVATAALVAVTAIGVSVSAQSPTLADVLARAAAYHTTYTRSVSGVSLQEEMQLMDVGGGKTRAIVRVSSDVVLVNLNGEVTALRDPYAIDTRPLRPREPRILRLIGAPATPTVRDWQTAGAFPAEAAHYFMLDIVVKVNEPTLALQFISEENQPRLKYKLDGKKKIKDVAVVGVRFEEPENPFGKHMLTTRSNARSSGRFWIDPATGAVYQTELWVESKHEKIMSESAMITVRYAPHAALGMLLPYEMYDSYEHYEQGAGPRPMGDGGDVSSIGGRASVQSRAIYSNATFAAINLAKIR
jgi:hypothetical protein